MKLLIAFILIYHFDMHEVWYVIAIIFQLFSFVIQTLMLSDIASKTIYDLTQQIKQYSNN